jgi:hypothetical protein
LAATVKVALGTVSPEHRPSEVAVPKLPEHPWNGHTTLIDGDGVTHEELCIPRIHGEDATVAATKDVVIFLALQIESQGRAAVVDGDERDPLAVAMEDADNGWLPVVGAEASDELGVGDEP